MSELERRLKERFGPPSDLNERVDAILRHANETVNPHPAQDEEDFRGSWFHGLAAAAALVLGSALPFFASIESDSLEVADLLVANLPEGQGHCTDPRADRLASLLDSGAFFLCNSPDPVFTGPPAGCEILADVPWLSVPNCDLLVQPPQGATEPTWQRSPADIGGQFAEVHRGGEQSIVLIHEAGEAPTFEVGAMDVVRIHRAEIEGYVLHELTSASAPRWLGHFAATAPPSDGE